MLQMMSNGLLSVRELVKEILLFGDFVIDSIQLERGLEMLLSSFRVVIFKSLHTTCLASYYPIHAFHPLMMLEYPDMLVSSD